MPKYGLGLETILVPWLYSCAGGQSRLRVTHCIISALTRMCQELQLLRQFEIIVTFPSCSSTL